MASRRQRSARSAEHFGKIRKSEQENAARMRVTLDMADLRAILFANDADIRHEIEFEIEEIEEKTSCPK